jgi:hypothetical protein
MEKKFRHQFSAKEDLFPRFYESDVEINDKKRHLEEHVAAVKMRYLEMFIRKSPPIDVQHFPSSGSFQRRHFVQGMHTRVISLLEKYKNAKYHSRFLYMYLFTGLCKNMEMFPVGTLDTVTRLMDIYQLSEREKASLFRLVVSRDESVRQSTPQPKQEAEAEPQNENENENETNTEKDTEPFNNSWTRDATQSQASSSLSNGGFNSGGSSSSTSIHSVFTNNSFPRDRAESSPRGRAGEKELLSYSSRHDSGEFSERQDENNSQDTDDEMAQLDLSNL